MINGEKIGVGIVTYKRRHTFEKCIQSLENCKDVDCIYVYEDGGLNYSGECLSKLTRKDWVGGGTMGNVGVGRAKNNALRYLLSKECDHIFLFEDDIYVKDPMVFGKYIQASKDSGIQHFNFSQHGIMNKTFEGFRNPNPKITVEYKNGNISFYPHCVGAMSYYSRKCLETVGLIDERYFNACEHVDHTYEIIKAGLHPSFWWFADIDKSWEYLGDEEWDIKKSTISSSPNHQQMMKDADEIFVEKHGHLPVQTPHDQLETFLKKLKEIKNNSTHNIKKILYLIVAHDKKIIDHFEKIEKYKNIDYRYLLVGIHDQDFSNDKIIQCDRLPNNLEEYKFFLAYTGWWAFVKNCIQDFPHDYFVCLEYDTDIIYEDLYKLENDLERNSPIYGIGNLSTNVCFNMDIISGFLRSQNIDLVLQKEWMASNNIIFRRDHFISYINDPLLERFMKHLDPTDSWTGHELERFTSAYCFVKNVPIDVVHPMFIHTALDSHDSQGRFDKYNNFITHI